MYSSYRLNIFGFPNAAGLDDQNLGILDQRAALEWVRVSDLLCMIPSLADLDQLHIKRSWTQKRRLSIQKSSVLPLYKTCTSDPLQPETMSIAFSSTCADLSL
jgi:hypothetical protein